MIVGYNPSESKYYTFKYRKTEKTYWEYYRVEVEKLIPEGGYTNNDIDLKDLGISEKHLLKISEKYAYFSSATTLHYIMPSFFISKEIVFDGFTSIPTHFYKSGGGLTDNLGFSITDGIRNFVGEKDFELSKFIITKNGKTQFKDLKAGYELNLNVLDFEKLANLSSLGRRQGQSISRNSISEFFRLMYPERSQYAVEEDSSVLKKMFLSSLNENLVGKFNRKEMDDIQAFYEKILSSSSKQSEFVSRNYLAIKEISLDAIISDFTQLMKKRSLEATWQKFFEKNLFIFDSRYIDFIPKVNIKVGRTAVPDFLVYDIYGFVDIYEIKTPDAELLRYDKSHDNYYFSNDVSSSVAQLEKYIFWATENRTQLENELKRNKGIDVNIIKPRGVLVIGSNRKFSDTKQKEDFKILRASLKNIDIILYDELLDSLNNLKQGFHKS